MKLPRAVWRRLSAGEREKRLRRPALADQPAIRDSVAKILRSVRRGGDTAVLGFVRRFDGVKLKSLEVTPAEKRRALKETAPEVKRAIERAAANVETFHKAQLPNELTVEIAPGLTCRRLPRAIDRVGMYIPGGSASLPSTVIMLGIPARLVGAPMRILCSPPRKDGRLDSAVITAAEVCGVGRLFKAGGAHAIAAMAYGTKSIPKVDKLFGPGNAWVTEAKQQAARDAYGAPCDMPAGPSEVMVIADSAANAEFVASDLLSQAEHGPDSQVVLVSDSTALLDAVGKALARQLAELPRKAIAEKALSKSLAIEVSNLEEAVEIANRYAPEHLIVQTRDPEALVPSIVNAGSVFLGRWSPESVGDYASGTNHVLPTYGYARAMGGVAVESFLKQMTVQSLTRQALAEIGPTVETLARVEGLEAHRRAVSLRLAEVSP